LDSNDLQAPAVRPAAFGRSAPEKGAGLDEMEQKVLRRYDLDSIARSIPYLQAEGAWNEAFELSQARIWAFPDSQLRGTWGIHLQW
jgi:hypothetical protein